MPFIYLNSYAKFASGIPDLYLDFVKYIGQKSRSTYGIVKILKSFPIIKFSIRLKILMK